MSSSNPHTYSPIGYVQSWYYARNGTPRQANVCPESRACIRLVNNLFSNPETSICDLDQFSHLWVIWEFSENTNKRILPKVHPPRLDGKSVSLFATRSPHRPNPIGLSLVKIESVKDDTIYVSGIDMLNGTPVLDIKPYISDYDFPAASSIDSEKTLDTDKVIQKSIHPEWIANQGVTPVTGAKNLLNVSFTPRAIKQLEKFHSKDATIHENEHLVKGRPLENLYVKHQCTKSPNAQVNETAKTYNDQELSNDITCLFCLRFLNKHNEVIQAITSILASDPRSVYRRSNCEDRLFFFTVDTLHVTCWFDDQEHMVEVLKVKPNFSIKQ